MQYQEEESAAGEHSDKRLPQPGSQDRPVEAAGDHSLNLGGDPLNPEGDHKGTPLQYDPWSALLHSQGIEVVDLGQIRSHMVQEPGNNLEVEQALDIMQERPSGES